MWFVISQCLEILLICFVIDLYFKSISEGKYALHDFTSFTFHLIYIISQDMAYFNKYFIIFKVYSVLMGQSVPYMSIQLCQLFILFSTSISLMIFCLKVLVAAERRVWKSPNITVDLSIAPFNSINFYLIQFEVLLLLSSWWTYPFIIMKCHFWLQ